VLLRVDALQSLLRERPVLAAALLDHALRETSLLTRTVLDLKLRSAVQRLADYLLGQLGDRDAHPARFVLPFEKRLLAARLGCTQENLSRAFAALRRVGVHTQGAVVVISDVAALRDLVQAPRRQAKLL
jgi:CRP/FNR family transcriptional activator FtrB